jgi:hypothetical protein
MLIATTLRSNEVDHRPCFYLSGPSDVFLNLCSPAFVPETGDEAMLFAN